MTVIVLCGTVQSIAVQTPSCWQERDCDNLSAVLLLFRDHDDDVSVAEACKKLNEVSGLRGMGRYTGGKPKRDSRSSNREELYACLIQILRE